MRALGMVFLAGTAAVVAWRLLATVVAGLVGLLFKVALVLLLLYVLLQVLNGRKDGD
jgi:hypothetical protein